MLKNCRRKQSDVWFLWCLNTEADFTGSATERRTLCGQPLPAWWPFNNPSPDWSKNKWTSRDWKEEQVVLGFLTETTNFHSPPHSTDSHTLMMTAHICAPGLTSSFRQIKRVNTIMEWTKTICINIHRSNRLLLLLLLIDLFSQPLCYSRHVYVKSGAI